MNKRDVVELTIETMEFGGESTATYEGRKIIFKGGIIGQKVKVMIKKIRKNKVEGKLLSVIEPSPLESVEPCPHFGRCGGCTMLTLPYQEQLEIKKNQLNQLFQENGHTEVHLREVIGSPSAQGYKNKMEFTFGDEEKGGELSLGMHMKNSPVSVIYVHSCLLVDEDYRKILQGTREFFRKEGLPHYRTLSHQGYLRHLVLRKGQNTGQIQVNIVTTSQLDFDMSRYVDMLRSLSLQGSLKGILHTINDSFADAVIAEKVNLLYGTDIFEDTLLGKQFNISPFSFFQTNTKGAEVLYQTVKEMIPGKKTVLFDLYSGTGTIGITVSDKADQVYGIELIEEAVTMAKENSAKNHIHNCQFIAGDVATEVSKLSDSPDLIILDPPRAGIHPKAMGDILSFNAKEILYISCNPKALMKDLKDCKANGYEVIEVRAVDLFPNTPHVECIALIQRVKS